MQLAFTSLNSFLLTTAGRVFSWGDNNSCLGREAEDTKKGDGADDGAGRGLLEALAERAALVRTEDGPRLVMFDGAAQRLNSGSRYVTGRLGD